MQVFHHADLKLLLKNAAQIALADGAVLNNFIQTDICFNVVFNIQKHAVKKRIAVDAVFAEHIVHHPEQPKLCRHPVQNQSLVQGKQIPDILVLIVIELRNI